MKKDLIIIGAGGHGEVCKEIAKQIKTWRTIYFLDDQYPTKKVSKSNIKIIGQTKDYLKYINDYEFFVAIGANDVRKAIIEDIVTNNGTLVKLIDEKTSIQDNVIIEDGTVIMPQVAINTGTTIKRGCIINTGSVVDHDCEVSCYSHISPGATLCGAVKCGELTWIGAGATVINNIIITDRVIIGAGTTVRKDINMKDSIFY